MILLIIKIAWSIINYDADIFNTNIEFHLFVQTNETLYLC